MGKRFDGFILVRASLKLPLKEEQDTCRVLNSLWAGSSTRTGVGVIKPGRAELDDPVMCNSPPQTVRRLTPREVAEKNKAAVIPRSAATRKLSSCASKRQEGFLIGYAGLNHQPGPAFGMTPFSATLYTRGEGDDGTSIHL
jgi:hypothetical protein